MCTVVNTSKNGNFFARTLDMAESFDEVLAVAPRKYPLSFKYEGEKSEHYAYMGIAYSADGAPLFYDAVNECGLCCAALRFAEECHYSEHPDGAPNLASFEVIPYIMARFSSSEEAFSALRGLSVTADSYSPSLPPSPLHFIVSDKKFSFVIESTNQGVAIKRAPLGVLTNAPDFSMQLAIYESGAIFDSLDFSSSARFARAAELAKRCDAASSLEMLSSMRALSVPRGFGKGCDCAEHRTVYTSCIDKDRLEYTVLHEKSAVPQVLSLKRENIDSQKLSLYEIVPHGVLHIN